MPMFLAPAARLREQRLNRETLRDDSLGRSQTCSLTSLAA